ncbi:MAG: hypothetical protein C0404_03755 [Verrucomicrobia bacterium]|nr:hypothetical protein [Verrucomicrobiota bacterium]
MLVLSVALQQGVFADVPQLMNYQGRLLSGTNLVNGNVGLSLRLFNVASGGSVIYEDSNTVTVVDGLYSTFIGDNSTVGSLVNALTNSQVWIEVAVNGVALAPRERLASAGYSLGTRGLLVTTNMSVVFNPAQNVIDPLAPLSAIGGGNQNIIQSNAYRSVIGGGGGNTIQTNANASFLGGGEGNSIQAYAYYSFLGGGGGNSIRLSAICSVLGGGSGNSIQTNAYYSVLGGGEDNSIQPDAWRAVLGGGQQNSIQVGAGHSFLGGGQGNSIQTNASSCFLGGGDNNSIQHDAYDSVLGGGSGNSIQHDTWRAFIGGGEGNKIGVNAYYSVIPGGLNNAVSNGARNAFAAGYRAKANHAGSFVWADRQESDFASTATNQFLIRASGGLGVNVTNSAYTADFGGRIRLRQEGAGNTAGHWLYQNGPANDRAFIGMDGDGLVGLWGNAGAGWGLVMNVTNGYVGIGTAVSTQALTVAGNVQANQFIGSGAGLSFANAVLSFGTQVRQMLNLWGTSYGIGVQTDTLYVRSNNDFSWFKGGTHNDARNNPGAGGTELMRLDQAGELTVNVLTIRGGADVAEPFIMSVPDIPAGAVVIIDEEHPGQLKISERAYDTRVAGIVSGANGVNPGLTLSQRDRLAGDRPVALTGRVYVQADAANGAIVPGDLLTTSGVPGHAMKVTDHARAQGAVLGKAMSALPDGRGLVLVLVTLQ